MAITNPKSVQETFSCIQKSLAENKFILYENFKNTLSKSYWVIGNELTIHQAGELCPTYVVSGYCILVERVECHNQYSSTSFRLSILQYVNSKSKVLKTTKITNVQSDAYIHQCILNFCGEYKLLVSELDVDNLIDQVLNK